MLNRILIFTGLKNLACKNLVPGHLIFIPEKNMKFDLPL